MRSLCAGVLLALATASLGATEMPPSCPPQPSDRGQSFELGLVYQSVLPSGLPDFKRTEPTYGGVFGIPILGGTLQLQMSMGGTPNLLTLYLAESNYRLEMETPFFNAFALFGVHYLYYGLNSGTKYGNFGANLGLGVAISMDRNFEMILSVRTYLQRRSTVSFGVGFSFLI